MIIQNSYYISGASKPSELDPRTILNLPDRGCCMCVPKAHRDKCYCGVDYSDHAEADETMVFGVHSVRSYNSMVNHSKSQYLSLSLSLSPFLCVFTRVFQSKLHC